jgi:acyl-[acyl-carrier-protein] desaturase
MSELGPYDTTHVDDTLLHELEPVVASELERHLKEAADWYPHEFIPWSAGKDFKAGEVFLPDGESELTEAARNVLILNLVTEDGLPLHFENLISATSRDGAWGAWAGRWTAEEGRHSIVIRDYLCTTRSVDLRKLEDLRMAFISDGNVPRPPSLAEALAYVALQEEATRLAHNNTAAMLKDLSGKRVMGRVSRDEGLHAIFYRNLIAASLEIAPSETLTALHQQLKKFTMPSDGIPDFDRLHRAYLETGVFDLSLVAEAAFKKVVDGLDIDQIEDLNPQAERARSRIYRRIEQLKDPGLLDRISQDAEEEQPIA